MSLAGFLVLLSHAVLAPLAVFHALLYKNEPRAALGWIGFCIVFPVVGPFIYAIFGVNRVRTRARQLHPLPTERLADVGPQTLAQTASIVQVGARIVDTPLYSGNEITVLYNGESCYPAMLEAIFQAQKSVFLCSYIFDSDGIGKRFVDALNAAQQRGVDVRVIVDAFGEFYSWPRISNMLTKAGVPVVRFMPMRIIPPSIRINLRTHRKILTVDGHTAFTGGMNISSRHLAENRQNSRRVRDIHFRLRGPIAQDLEALFREDWRYLSGENLPPTYGLLLNEQRGSARCRLIQDGPNEDADRLALLYLGLIGCAQHRIGIMTPYFLPPQEILGALQAAALRGVAVDVVLPGKNNLPYMHWASRHFLPALLQWGVNVAYQPPPFDHSKLLLVDGDYALIGSANLDARSLRLNFELGVELFDSQCLQALWQHFDSALAKAQRLSLGEILNRPLWQRTRDAATALMSPYL